MSALRPLRVVLLVPDGAERVRRLGLLWRVAAERRYVVDSVAATVGDALQAIWAGWAERVLVVDGSELWPVFEITTETPPTVPQSQRRPKRLR